MSSKNFKIVLVSVILDAAVILEDIGLCYIAAYLRKKGYDVNIVSEMVSKLTVDKITIFKPDIVGFSTYNQTIKKIKELSTSLKAELPNVKIVYGGNTATFYSEELMQDCPELDFIVKGEGEFTTYELVNCLSNNLDFNHINGLVYRKDGIIICNPASNLIENLDILPEPARDILEKHQLKIAILSESRGCTHNCYFCSSHSFWKEPNKKFCWRTRSTELILDEIQNLYNTYHVHHFWFSDPSFEDPGFNEKRMTDICNGIIERNLTISFIIYIRGDFYKKVSDKLMNLLTRAGLSSVFIGAESINDSDRKIYGKEASTEDIINSMHFFKKYDISVDIGFINFNPYSTFEGLKQNCDFLWKHGYFVCEHHLSKIMVFKGSRIYNRLLNDNLLYNGSYDNLFGYHFIDSRIEELCTFLSSFMKTLRSKTHVFEEITILTHLQQARLACIKRHIHSTSQNGMRLKKLLDEYAQQLDFYCMKINDEIHEWYSNLLDYAEQGKTSDYLLQYSLKNLDIVQLQNYTNEMKKLKILLIKKIGKNKYSYLL